MNSLLALISVIGLGLVTNWGQVTANSTEPEPPAGYVWDGGYLLSTTAGKNDTEIHCGSEIWIHINLSAVHALAIGPLDKLHVGNHPICGGGHVDKKMMAQHGHGAGVGMSNCWGMNNVTEDGSYEFKFDMSDCMPTISKASDGMLRYSYDIIKVPTLHPDSPIQRFNCSCATFTCSYPMEVNLTASNAVQPMIKELTIEDKDAEGRIDYHFFLADCDYNPLPLMSPVPVDEYIYAEIGIEGMERTELIIQAGACWASASPDFYNMTHSYEIIRPDGCCASHPWEQEEAIKVIENYDCRVRFAFRAFVWSNLCIDDQKIYVHCTVKLCEEDGSGKCNQTACEYGTSDYRRRRSVGDDDDDVHSVTFGPVKVTGTKPPVDVCEKNNGGCDELCTSASGAAICSCLPGKALNTDGHSCRDVTSLLRKSSDVDAPRELQRDMLIERMREAREAHHIELGLVAVMMIMVFFVALTVLKRNNKK